MNCRSFWDRLSLILASVPPKTVTIDDAGNLFDFATDEPVQRGFEFVERIWAFDTEAVDFADRRPRRELRFKLPAGSVTS